MKTRMITALLLACFIFTGVFPTASMAEELSNVEISFYVGDDTLMINGKPVTVVAPYIVGEGTTLVPVRVITESFGAKVDWDGDTRTVTITYKDIMLKFVISYDKVLIKDRFLFTLAAAPELYNDGYTMVPLRFISEAFGAKVTYDDTSGLITVSLKEDGISDREYALNGLSFSLPNDYYAVTSDGTGANIFNYKYITNESIHLSNNSKAFIYSDLPENTDFMDYLVSVAEAHNAEYSWDIFYEILDINGRKVFHRTENIFVSGYDPVINHDYIIDNGDKAISIWGQVYSDLESESEQLNKLLLNIVKSIKIEDVASDTDYSVNGIKFSVPENTAVVIDDYVDVAYIFSENDADAVIVLYRTKSLVGQVSDPASEYNRLLEEYISQYPDTKAYIESVEINGQKACYIYRSANEGTNRTSCGYIFDTRDESIVLEAIIQFPVSDESIEQVKEIITQIANSLKY